MSFNVSLDDEELFPVYPLADRNWDFDFRPQLPPVQCFLTEAPIVNRWELGRNELDEGYESDVSEEYELDFDERVQEVVRLWNQPSPLGDEIIRFMIEEEEKE